MLPIRRHEILDMSVSLSKIEESLKKNTIKSSEELNSYAAELILYAGEINRNEYEGKFDSFTVNDWSTKISALLDKIEEIRVNTPSMFKSEKSFKDNTLIQNVLEKVKDFFQSFTNGYVFLRVKQQKSIAELLRHEPSLTAEKLKLNTEIAEIRLSLRKIVGRSVESELTAQLTIKKIKLDEVNKLLDQIDKINLNVENQKSYLRKASVLGAERITLETEDQVKLDGLYFDAGAFRKSLNQAGGELVTYTLGDGTGFQGISLSAEKWNPEGKRLLESLKFLGGIATDASKPGLSAGWAAVKEGNRIVLIRAKELPVKKGPESNETFRFDKHSASWIFNADKYTRKSSPLDDSTPASGTVILSSGALGIYENQTEEAIGYLFKNMNVLQFNFRGFANSEGSPTEKGLKVDMESAYQFARSRGQPASKILFKALCMSGGPAAFTAARHPETHIFLDQSYSSFKKLIIEVAVKQLNQEIDKSISSDFVKKFLKKVGKFMIELAPVSLPDYHTAKLLAKNNGNKAIAYLREDPLVKTKHVEDNFREILKAGKVGQISLYNVPGNIHDKSFEMRALTRFDFLDKKTKDALKNLTDEMNIVSIKLSIEESFFNKLLTQEEGNLSKLEEDIKSIQDELTNNDHIKDVSSREGLSQEVQLKKNAIAKINNEIEKFKKTIDKLKTELKAIEAKILKILPGGENASLLFKEERVAMSLLHEFLQKCNLADDLLKSLNPQDSSSKKK